MQKKGFISISIVYSFFFVFLLLLLFIVDNLVNNRLLLNNLKNNSKNEISLPNKYDICSNNTNFVNCIKSQFSAQGTNNLYHHDGTLENGIEDGSYRYSGTNPNNYVCYGYENNTGASQNNWCPEENLYRIIGLFQAYNKETGLIEERIKLIKAYGASEEDLGASPQGGVLPEIVYYNWSGIKNINSNDWNSSVLNTTFLNVNYLNKLGTKWTNKIATTEWKIGGNNYGKFITSAADAYQNEILNPYEDKTYISKIGLMYISDYAFANDSSNWLNKWCNYYYEDSNSRVWNWLHLSVKQLTITRNSEDYNKPDNKNVVSITSYGAIDPYNYSSGLVRPTFYLNSDVLYGGGLGTEEYPMYIIL